MNEFRCVECNKTFGSKQALEMHDQSKHPEKIKKPFINLSYKQKKKLFTYLIVFLILTVVVYGGYGLFKKAGEEEANSYTKTNIHWHAYPKVIICDEEKELPYPLGQAHLGNALLHTHSPPDNFIHIEGRIYSVDDIKLGKYFDVIGVSFNQDQIFDIKNGDLCNGELGKLKMFVNDVENFEFREYILRDQDNILIKFE